MIKSTTRIVSIFKFHFFLLAMAACKNDMPESPKLAECLNNQVSFESIQATPLPIVDPEDFLRLCPLNDPIISTILTDFNFRIDGKIVDQNVFACTQNYSVTTGLNDALIYLQTLRFLYYIDRQMSGHLPWTNSRMYDWVKSNINTINLVTDCSGYKGFYSGRTINICGQDQKNQEFDRKVEGILGNIAFLLYSARYFDGYGLENCCPIGVNCDIAYDQNNLGMNGLQIWFARAIDLEKIDIGLSNINEARKSEIKRFIKSIFSDYAVQSYFCKCHPILE